MCSIDRVWGLCGIFKEFLDRGPLCPGEQETTAHVAIATRGTYNRRNIAPIHNQTSVGTRCGVRMGGGLVLVLAGGSSECRGQAQGPHIHPTPPLVLTRDRESE